jgi:hypothetical protein
MRSASAPGTGNSVGRGPKNGTDFACHSDVKWTLQCYTHSVIGRIAWLRQGQFWPRFSATPQTEAD